MSLKDQLRKGLLVILAVIIIFIILISKSYIDLDSFVMEKLPRNIGLARQYERVANQWHLIGQQAQNIVRDSYKNQDSTAWQDEIEKAFDKIEKNLTDKEHKDKAREIRTEYSHYINNFGSLERLVKNRNDIHNKNTAKRSNAAKSMRSEIEALMKSFKDMLSNMQKSVKSQDFQESLDSGASSLLEKIKRIETDLIVSEKEVSIYLNANPNNPVTGKNTRKNSSNRVEQRLRSILHLIERSKKETKNPVQKRVLTNIGTSVKSFSTSFSNLRNVIEESDSDVTELEDQIITLYTNLEDLEQHGIELASKEAEYFWEKIDAVSNEQIEHEHNTYKLIGIFLALVFIGCIYLTVRMPRSISDPLRKLSKQIAGFSLDSKFLDLPDSEISEIDSLGKDFSKMAKNLVTQGRANTKNLAYMADFTSIISNLHEASWDHLEEEAEESVIKIMNSLKDSCPKIDHIKVMVKKQDKDPDTGEVLREYFRRLSDPVFSDKFKETKEYAEYCHSIGYMDLKEYKKYCEANGISDNYPPNLDETLPIGEDSEESLSNYYYEEYNRSTNISYETLSNFFQSEISPNRISDNPILTNRSFERGLNGSVIVEKLIVPGREDDFGLLFVYFSDPDVKLSWQEIFLIKTMAGHVAFIVDTVSLLKDHDAKKFMDDQLIVAQEIQENLLPSRVPNIDGIKICKAWKPAAEVGGDYFDFFKLSRGRIGIVIADASGKNVTGAMLMTVLKTTLSTMSLSRMTPGEALSKANNIISGNITADKFITAMYIIIDPKSGEIELASAGHNPALISTSFGVDLKIDSKNAKGLPLGIMEDYPYDTISFKMNSKDMLIMYTDGVTESRNADDEEFEESGLRKFISKPRSIKEDTAKKLIEELEVFSAGVKQHDDITVITVEMI